MTVRNLARLQARLTNARHGNEAKDIRDLLESVYPRNVTPSAVPTTGWSWVNQGSATVETVNGALSFATPAVGANNIIAYARTAPGTPWTITVGMAGVAFSNFDAAYGMALRESSTGKLTLLGMRPRNSQELTVENWTNPTTFSSVVVTQVMRYMSSSVYFRITDNGTNLLFSIGALGGTNSTAQVTSVSRTSFMAGGPDQVGVFARDNNTLVRWAIQVWEQG